MTRYAKWMKHLKTDLQVGRSKDKSYQ